MLSARLLRVVLGVSQICVTELVFVKNEEAQAIEKP
jgi:hypothetical protein